MTSPKRAIEGQVLKSVEISHKKGQVLTRSAESSERRIRRMEVEAERERLWLETGQKILSSIVDIAKSPLVTGVGGIALVQYLGGKNYDRKTGAYVIRDVYVSMVDGHQLPYDTPYNPNPSIYFSVPMPVPETVVTPIISPVWMELLEAAILAHLVLSGLNGMNLPQAVAAGKAIGDTAGGLIGAAGSAAGKLTGLLTAIP